MTKHAPTKPPVATYKIAVGPNPDGLNAAAARAQKVADEGAEKPAAPADEREN